MTVGDLKAALENYIKEMENEKLVGNVVFMTR